MPDFPRVRIRETYSGVFYAELPPKSVPPISYPNPSTYWGYLYHELLEWYREEERAMHYRQGS